MTRSLLLVRHGQIDANARGRWHGSTDSPLTRTGRRQVLRIAQRIRRDWGDAASIYSSPMIRCLRTAEAIGSALEQPVTLDADLREYSIGELEDTTFASLQATTTSSDAFVRIATSHRRAASRSIPLQSASFRRCDAFTRPTTRRDRSWSSVMVRRWRSRWPRCLTLTRITGQTTKSTIAA